MPKAQVASASTAGRSDAFRAAPCVPSRSESALAPAQPLTNQRVARCQPIAIGDMVTFTARVAQATANTCRVFVTVRGRKAPELARALPVCPVR